MNVNIFLDLLWAKISDTSLLQVQFVCFVLHSHSCYWVYLLFLLILMFLLKKSLIFSEFSTQKNWSVLVPVNNTCHPKAAFIIWPFPVCFGAHARQTHLYRILSYWNKWYFMGTFLQMHSCLAGDIITSFRNNAIFQTTLFRPVSVINIYLFPLLLNIGVYHLRPSEISRIKRCNESWSLLSNQGKQIF